MQRPFIQSPATTVNWRTKFLVQCNEKFTQKFCQLADAQIQSEGGYNPLRWAEYAEGYCSWGMWQNNVCIHQNWTETTAKYVYWSLRGEYGASEKQRLSHFARLLDGDWQITKLLELYRARMEHPQTFFRGRVSRDTALSYCTREEIRGELLSPEEYCAIRLHNWNGGKAYVARVLAKKQSLYN